MNLYQPDPVTQHSGHIGARQTRVEDAALLRGLGCYADDAATAPGTLHAAIVRSPHPHARITAVDFSKALLMKGVHGVLVGCLYLPNGNPQPGPKFDYKLAWFERLISYAKDLQSSDHPVVLAGDYNVVPTDMDIYNPRSWLKDALLQPESRACYQRLLDQGWLDAIRHLYPDERVYTFWDYFRNHWARNAGLRIDHLLLNPELAPYLKRAGVDAWVRNEAKASDHAPVWIELGTRRARS